MRAFGDRLSNGVATVDGNYTLVKGADGYWRYAVRPDRRGQAEALRAWSPGKGTPPQASKNLAPAPSAKADAGRDPEGRHR